MSTNVPDHILRNLSDDELLRVADRLRDDPMINELCARLEVSKVPHEVDCDDCCEHMAFCMHYAA